MMAASHQAKWVQVAAKIAPQSKLIRTWSLKGGISAEMTALEVEDLDGYTQRLIVRRPDTATLAQNPNATEVEFKLLRMTRSLGLPTPTAQHLDQSGTILPTPYLVVEYIDGEPEFAPAHRADFVRQLAHNLAKINSVYCSHLDLSFLPEHTTGCAETLGQHPRDLDGSLAEGRIRDTLASLWPLPQRNARALLHGDYWPGNVLWRKGELVAVIDWEDAKLGDPLIDFAISRLDVAWIFGIDALRLFSDHYRALMSIDYTDLPYWDLCAALRLIRLAGPDLAEWAAFFAPYGRHDITERTMRADYHTFVSQAFDTLTA